MKMTQDALQMTKTDNHLDLQPLKIKTKYSLTKDIFIRRSNVLVR